MTPRSFPILPRIGVVLLAAALFAARAGASVLYVDAVHGDNAHSGGYADPLATITYALEQVGVTEVRVLPGSYNADSETFPLQPGNVTLTGYANETTPAADPANHIVTGAGDSVAETLLSYGPGDTATLGGLTFTGTGGTAGALRIHAATVTVYSCVFTALGRGIHIDGNAAVVAVTNGQFQGNTGITVLIASGSGRFTAHDTVWRNNVNGWVQAADTGGQLAFYDCRFEGNSAPGALAAVLNHSNQAAIYDRCRFIANTNAHGLLGGASGTKVHWHHVNNSLFASNTLGRALLFSTVRLSGLFRNVTIVDNTLPDGLAKEYIAGSAAPRLYNSIIAHNTRLRGDGQLLPLLYDTVIWDTPFITDLDIHVVSENVMEFDPEFVDRTKRDYRLVPWSAAIDTGNNAHAQGDHDLDRNPRRLDGTDDAIQTVDLGAYESPFFEPQTPVFSPDRALYAVFAGTLRRAHVSILPPIAETVDAGMVTDGPLWSLPVTFTDGHPARLALGANAGSYGATGILYRATLSETTEPVVGVADRMFGVRVHDRLVTHGAPARLFLKTGVPIDIPVRLIADAYGGSPSEITVSNAVTGVGDNHIAWQGGKTIAVGESATDGGLRIEPVSGINTVTLTLNVAEGPSFVFAESGTMTASFQVIALDMPVYVSGAGCDGTGIGTVTAPLRSINFALELVDDGDEIAVLPGTYDAFTEPFPIAPGGVRIAGAGDAGSIVVGGQSTERLLIYEAGETGTLKNITLTGTTAGAIRVEDATLTLDGVRFVDMTTAYEQIRMVGNAAVVTLTNGWFENNTGITVLIAGGSGRFTAHDTVWRNNLNGWVQAADTGGQLAFYDCRFEGNSAPGALAAVLNQSNQAALYDRCRFIANTNAHGLLGGSSGTKVHWHHVNNSLFAGNVLGRALLFSTVRLSGLFHNVTIADNTLPDGLVKEYVAGSAAPRLYNTIIAHNTRLRGDGQLLPLLYDTVIWDTPFDIDTDIAAASENVMTFDPEFRNAMDGDYRPRHVSAALDAGNNDYVAGEWDLDGNPRIVDHNRDKQAIVDLGAYEIPTPRRGILMIAR